jgi:hypothetical protein
VFWLYFKSKKLKNIALVKVTLIIVSLPLIGFVFVV